MTHTLYIFMPKLRGAVTIITPPPPNSIFRLADDQYRPLMSHSQNFTFKYLDACACLKLN